VFPRPSRFSERRQPANGRFALRLLWLGFGLWASAARTDPLHDEFLLGEALFSGKIDLKGRIYTHSADLPPSVVRCANCHAVADGPDLPLTQAPRLTHDLLLRPQQRRGGPASTYDRDKFCALLRLGQDPAFVLISVEMPRYAIDDAQCRALWRYVNGSAHEEQTR